MLKGVLSLLAGHNLKSERRWQRSKINAGAPGGVPRKIRAHRSIPGWWDEQATTATSRAPFFLLAVLMAFDPMAATGRKPDVINNPFQLGKRFISTLICQVALRID